MTEPTPPTTICIHCVYLEREGVTDMWYSYLCSHPAVQTEPSIDPVTGKTVYVGVNDLGGPFTTENPRPFCRTVNFGNCAMYKGKGPDDG